MDTRADLRPARVLEDPTGRRLRRLRWVGRGIALLFLLWLLVIGLGALGAGPTGAGLGNASEESAPPPASHGLPTPRQQSRADLAPAPQAASLASAGVVAPNAAPAPGHQSVGSTSGSTAPGNAGSAPGHQPVTTTSQGHSGSATGHQREHGNRHTTAP